MLQPMLSSYVKRDIEEHQQNNEGSDTVEYRGSSVYENDEFLQNYLKRRMRKESPNEMIEKPAFLNLLGDMSNKDVLELGCGAATLAKELAPLLGSYTGIDGSQKMLELALKNLAGIPNVKLTHASLETYDFKKETYDCIFSQLTLHYLEDFKQICENIYNSLRTGGEFVFSVQHPVLTSAFISGGGKRENWVVDDYFLIGERVEPWIDEKVVKYHRTIEQYFKILQDCQFNIMNLSEATPIQSSFSSEKEWKRRQRIPLFLLFACEKSRK